METRITQKITQQLKSLITQGIYKPGNRLETERELCLKFGTSRRSLRSAISKLEKDGLVEKYPHRGVVVSQNATQIVGVSRSTHATLFVRWTNDAMLMELTNGILRMARQYEDQPVIFDARCSHERYLEAIRNPPQETRGMLVIPFNHPDYLAAMEHALAAGVKIVLIDRLLDTLNVSNIMADNFMGGYQAARHLIQVHKRPVYYIGYPLNPSSSRDRYLGCAEAMKEYGYRNMQDYLLELTEPEYDSTVHPQENWQGAYEVSVRLFTSRKEDRYCIFTADDFAAEGVYHAAEKCGLKVGENVFVVGFDDLPLCERLNPPLSSILQPREQMGYEAAKLLYQELSGQITSPVHRVLPIELKIRASSAG